MQEYSTMAFNNQSKDKNKRRVSGSGTKEGLCSLTKPEEEGVEEEEEGGEVKPKRRKRNHRRTGRGNEYTRPLLNSRSGPARFAKVSVANTRPTRPFQEER